MQFHIRTLLIVVALLGVGIRIGVAGSIALGIWLFIARICYRHARCDPAIVPMAVVLAAPAWLVMLLNPLMVIALIPLTGMVALILVRRGPQFPRWSVLGLVFISLLPCAIFDFAVAYDVGFKQGQSEFRQAVVAGKPNIARMSHGGRSCIRNIFDLQQTKRDGYEAGFKSESRKWPDAESELIAMGAKFSTAATPRMRRVCFPAGTFKKRYFDNLVALGDVTEWDLSEQSEVDDRSLIDFSDLSGYRVWTHYVQLVDVRGTSLTSEGVRILQICMGPQCVIKFDR